ncbi:hypothetical protein AB0M43_38375 [Longispora sp. NPDC051575]|uniref:hypothetical protein n=1 Tax=Longispora sp. NPDC051575 TaxID=3154943 RepID=UPI00343CAB10
MTTPNPNELAGLVAAIAVEQTQVRGDLRTVETNVGAIETQMAQLPAIKLAIAKIADSVKALAGTEEEEPSALWDWSTMTRKDAELAWSELSTWMDTVLSGVYRKVAGGGGNHSDPDMARLAVSMPSLGGDNSSGGLVPVCWMHHPDLVAELSWLCQMWLSIYRTPAGTARVGDWHDRYLPGVLARISTSTARTCLNQAHKPLRPAAVSSADALSAAIRADVANREQ